jgi:nitrous oxidase accessory protein
VRLHGLERKAFTLACTFLVSGLLATSTCRAGDMTSKPLVVSKQGPFQSIQEAIHTARAGDTIRVESGFYRGNLILDKQVTLEGVGKPIIHGDGQASVITVTADGCVVRGFVIESSGTMLIDEDSGILLKSSHNQIEQNELRDVLFGIYLFSADHNLIADNTIRGREYLELGERGSGIHIWNSRDNVIRTNNITLLRDGMYFQNAYHTTITGNRVSELRYGIHYMFSDDNKFEDNLFYNNVAGAAIMYSHRIELRRNGFLHNRGFSSFGILFQDSDDCLVEDNLIVDNVVGIFMEALRRSVFRRNLIAENDTAIQIFSSAEENLIERNNFSDNLSPIQVIGKRTTTLWSQPGSGNYWSDYAGYDLDADGIGDVPFKIENVFEHLEGNYPRLRLYLLSPAAQAMALGERTFPVIEGSQEFDFYPRMKPVELSVQMPELDGRPVAKHSAVVLPLVMVAFSVFLMVQGIRR